MHKQTIDRMSQLGDTVQLSRDTSRQQLDSLTSLMLDLQKKVDQSEYRLNRVEQINEGLQMKFNAVQPKQ